MLSFFFFFFLMIRRPPRSPLFPYPTLSLSFARHEPRAEPAGDVAGDAGLPELREMVDVAGEDHVDRSLRDRKSTRLNSSHLVISYAVFCLKKKMHNARIIMDCD